MRYIPNHREVSSFHPRFNLWYAESLLEAYEMTKDGFIFLVMGFTGHKAASIKEAYINAFNRMANQLQAGTNDECQRQSINAMSTMP